MNDLYELAGRIADAKEHLNRAVRIGCNMLGTGPDRREAAWPALEELVDALGRLARELEALPGEEMAAAMEAASAYQDEMSDRADGLSY